MKTTTLAISLALMLAFATAASADTLTFDSINTNTAPFRVDITTTNYLAQYGITLVNNSPGTEVDVRCANADYNSSCTSGNGTLVAVSGPNVLGQSGNGAESYTLNFSTALTTFSFFTAGIYDQSPSGTLVAPWSVTAYDGATQLGSVGNANFGNYFTNIPAQQYTLNGANITSATFAFKCGGVCGEGLALDNLSSPDLVAVPEPATLWLLVGGLLALFGLAVRQRRTGAAGISS